MARILKKKIIKISGLDVEVHWKHIKHMYLRVCAPDGHLLVTAPAEADIGHIRDFVNQKAPWILKRMEMLIEKAEDKIPHLSSGQVHQFLGKSYELEIRHASSPWVELKGDSLVLTVPESFPKSAYFELLATWYSCQLEDILVEMLPYWEEQFQVGVEKVTIKIMKSRWGSANARRRRISINLDVIRFEKPCIEYVLVHEMAHFFEPNHGEGFKTLMDEMLPGWRELDRKFRNDSPRFYLMK
ncbi:MAG: M48 family metallopeptidase [Thermodesulfobacteria bacterium]|nr:M48 family metallopeptidase [Thermodesulfobacteriota bacterium]